jgi:hypothetical protein
MTEWPGVSESLPNAKLRVLSLGAGVQSTTLALMAKHGDLPAPDFAVFADTGWEPRKVYEHLDWLTSVLPFPVYRVHRAGPNLGELSLMVARGERAQAGNQLIPFFSGGGLSPKQCSKEFKTRPVARFVRSQLAEPPSRGCGPIVEMWLGMSQNELQRLKKNERPWIRNRYPLVEARMSRLDCQAWLSERQYSAPRSACIFCGYHTEDEWAELMADPYERPRLIAFDEGIRALMPEGAYLTPAHKPLAEIDFSKPDTAQIDLFANECEGMCGA